MARPTDDPKRSLMAVRLSEDDVRTLARLAAEGDCTPSEVLRRLVREKSGSVSPERWQQRADKAQYEAEALTRGAHFLAGETFRLEKKAAEAGEAPDDKTVHLIGLLRFAAEWVMEHAKEARDELAKTSELQRRLGEG
jgi:hypothetical protein